MRNIESHIRAGAFEKALNEVKGDEAMELELAALILEDAAVRGISTPLLVSKLAGARDPGKRALERMAKSEETVSGELSRIALTRNDDPEAPDLVRWINHDHSDVRAAAAEAWHDVMDMNLLTRLIVDHSPTVRLYAVRGVGLRPGQEDVSLILSEALRLDPSPKVRAEAARFGSRLGDGALGLLKASLVDESMGIRLAAIQGLADMKDYSAFDLIEDIASQPASEESVAAAAELARLGRDKGERLLVEALSDERPVIRKSVMLMLERGKVAARRKLLMERLSDKSKEVSLLAVHLLRNDRDAREDVIKTLKDIARIDKKLADEANAKLANLGDQRAIFGIEARLRAGGEEDILSLMRMVSGLAPLRAAFVSLLADDKEPVRIEASMALLSIR